MEPFLPLQVILLHCSEGQQRKLHQHFKHAALQSTNTHTKKLFPISKTCSFFYTPSAVCPWTRILFVPLGCELHCSARNLICGHWAQNPNLCASHSSKLDFTVSNLCWCFFYASVSLCRNWLILSSSSSGIMFCWIDAMPLSQPYPPIQPFSIFLSRKSKKRGKSHVKNINYFIIYICQIFFLKLIILRIFN